MSHRQAAESYLQCATRYAEADSAARKAKTEVDNLRSRLEELRVQLGHAVGRNVPRRAYVFGQEVVVVELREGQDGPGVCILEASP